MPSFLRTASREAREKFLGWGASKGAKVEQEQELRVIDVLRHALRRPSRKHAFVDLQRERWGWQGSYRQAHTRVDQWLDEFDHHRFPVEALEDAVRVIGDAAFLDPLLHIEAVLLRQKRRDAEEIKTGRMRRAG